MKKILLYLRWILFDYEPYSLTFRGFLHKLEKDESEEGKKRRIWGEWYREHEIK